MQRERIHAEGSALKAGFAAWAASCTLAAVLLAALAGFALGAPAAWAYEQAAATAADDQLASGEPDAAGDGAAPDGASASEGKPAAEKPSTTKIDTQGNRVNTQQTPDSSFIYDTPIADLAAADSYLDGQTVQVAGEVVGDRIFAEFDPGFCWITLEATDGTFSEVTLFMSVSMAQAIDTFGAYGKRGTVVQARGTFNLSCPQHEGLSDVHVDHLSVVTKGVDMSETLDWSTFTPGIVLSVLGGVCILVFYRLRERQR